MTEVQPTRRPRGRCCWTDWVPGV